MLVQLKDIINLYDNKRKPISKINRLKMNKVFPYYGANGIIDYVDDYIFIGDYILLGEDGTVSTQDGKPILILTKPNEKFWVSNHAHVIKPKTTNIKYLYYLLQSTDITNIITGAVQPKINQENLLNLSVNIHKTLEEQLHIVDIIIIFLFLLLYHFHLQEFLYIYHDSKILYY